MASPGLDEMTTTTLRNRRSKVPSSSPKQAKTMAAIAHGWKPKGKAAAIPVAVAKEFNAADNVKRASAPPAIGPAPKAGAGESKKGYDRSGHFKGNPGFAEGKHVPGQSYHDEQKEHWGKEADGGKSAPMPHVKQPHTFPQANNAHGYTGPVRQGCYRLSGHPGAHRIGKR